MKRLLTPRWFPFMKLALWAKRLLLRRLTLAVLSPLLQLEINELPHHPGLSQADGCQARHPNGMEKLARV